MKKKTTNGKGNARPAAKNTPASVQTGSRTPGISRPSKASQIAQDGAQRGIQQQGLPQFDIELSRAIERTWTPSELDRAKRLMCLQHMSPSQLDCLKRHWIMEFAELPLSKEQREALGECDAGEEWKNGGAS